MHQENLPLLITGPNRNFVGDREDIPIANLGERLGESLVTTNGSNFDIGLTVPEERKINYSWCNINASTKPKSSSRSCLRSRDYEEIESSDVNLLQRIDGMAKSGEITAILGSSGSGKTTFLNCINYIPMDNVTVTGVTYINGKQNNAKQLRSVSGFVQQEDIFIPTLTVKEHLTFHALVRIDRSVDDEEKMSKVNEVIQDLLLKNCENTVIGYIDQGGISGGEKKRLSFASELLTNPQILFCDEPTSGLDSFMALHVMQSLKAMAATGKTIVCTIHQPSSEIFLLIDKFMVLAQGRLAFMGNKTEIESFLKTLDVNCPRHYNPAEYLLFLTSISPDKENSCLQSINLICKKFLKFSEGKQLKNDASMVDANTPEVPSYWWINPSNRRYKNTSCTQFRALMWRSWISLVKNPMLVKVRLLQTIITSLLIGAIYFGQELNQEGVTNINGVLFIFLTNMTFQNVFAVIHVFTAELPVFLRENRSGMYRTDIYFFSKTLAELPIFVLLPFIFTAICYFMIGLNSVVYKFLITCAIVILVANVSISFGYLVSCVSRDTSMALALGAPLIIPFLLFGGYFMNINSIPIYFKWLSYVSWFKLGNEALMINQWNNVTEIECINNSTICPKNGHVVLESYSFSEENFTLDITGLFLLIVGFRILAFLALLKKTYC